MVKTCPGSGEPHWALRDWLATAGLFLATAGVVLWQNAHVAVLWDLSYVLDSAARIAVGQMPYRDFPFAHAPLTFLIQAAIIRLTGRVFFHHVIYTAIVGGLGTVLTWRIELRTLRGRVDSAWAVALVLVAPLTVLGIYCILPLPSYDCDCAFSILIAVWMLQQLSAADDALGRGRLWVRGFLTGAALCVPVFFKQNMGLPFFAASGALVLLALTAKFILPHNRSLQYFESQDLLAVFAGAFSVLVAAVLLLHFTAGVGNYFHWTIQFAAKRRLPGLRDMFEVYRDPNLLWTLPCVAAGLLLLRSPLVKARWGRVAAAGLLAAPFLFAVCSLFLYDDADERGDALLALWPMLLILAGALALWNLFRLRRDLDLRALMPIVLLAAINGTLMSQQLWGSTYAIWPLLVLLVAEMIAYLAEFRPGFATPMALAITATLLICGGFYTTSEERLSYAQFPEGPVEHSTFPQLAGMSVAGPYLPDFEELLRFANARIPFSDGVILLPGEDPFYFVTGRVPQFPVLLFDPATDPYSPAQVVEEARAHRIRWLIVKRELQIRENPMPEREATVKGLMSEFTLAARLRGYDVYRR